MLAAGYMLWMFQRVFFGKVTKPENEKITDMTLRERAIMVPLILLIFFIGLYPKPILSRMEPALNRVLAKVEQARIVREQTTPPPLYVGPPIDQLDVGSTDNPPAKGTGQ